MKGIKLTELLAEIKANLVAFVSIAMFVCLGIGLFLGIQWGGEAIGGISDKTFEEGQLHDIEVQFPYGLTEDDLTKLAAVEGVTDVEPGYTSFASMIDGPASYVIKVQSLTQRIDLPKLVEGKLPTKADEVAMLSFWAEEHEFEVGDTITLVSDADDEDDADGMEQLTAREFTITGLVEHPAYLSKVVGSLGSASIGAGRVDCVVFAPEASFDAESYDDCYSNAYLRCDGLREYSTFSDDYKNGLATVLATVDEMGGELGDARYKDVRSKADEKVSDAEQEIADADGKLKDAEGEIADGEKEIKDGEQALADGAEEIDDAKGQIADGEQQLGDARQELEDGESKYSSAKSSAEKKQAEAKKKLDAGKAKLDDAQAEYDESKSDYDDAKSNYDRLNKLYKDNKADYDKSVADIAALRKQKKTLEEKTTAYDKALAAYVEAEAGLKAAEAEAEIKASELKEANGASAAAVEEYKQAEEAVTDAQTAYDAAAQAVSVNPDDEEAQAKLAAAEAALNEAKTQEEEAKKAKSSAASKVTSAEAAKKSADEALDTAKKEKDNSWPAVKKAYSELKPAYDKTKDTHNELLGLLSSLSDEYDLGVEISDSDKIKDLSSLTESNPEAPSVDAHGAIVKAETLLEAVDSIEYEEEGKTYRYENLPEALATAKQVLDNVKGVLDNAKKELDQGWADYNAAKAEYDRQVANGKAQLAEARSELDDGWADYRKATDDLARARAELADAIKTYEEKKLELEDGKKELEDAKKTVIEKRQQLEDAKKELEDAKKKLDEMEEYEWIVLARPENGGVNSLNTIKVMMGNVRWAMALLFVLVGLFVCYSAVARLVNDEVVQIGTKKACGFRENEIAAEYLSFSGIAVLAGVVLSVLVAIVAVQGIMNPACAASFTLPSFPPYFNLLDLLAGGGIELALILLSTWFAIHGLLKKNAVVLLNGGEMKTAKQHFYEKWGAWNKLGLYTQTIINNCVNDTRRVAATLVGVIGCTAIIVTAVTLWSNVSRGFERHYNEIYGFDTIVYLDEDVDDAATKVSKALDEQGLHGEQAHLEVMQVRQTDGYRNVVNLFVPTNDKFESMYQVLAVDGEGDPAKADGVLISQAYADHMGVGVGDEVKVTENNGRAHTLKVAGVFEYYLLRNEFVLSADQYRKEFGTEPKANVLLAGAGGMDLDPVRKNMRGVEGYDTLVDDYDDCYYAFHEISSLLETVVAVYLLLSALMALVVLLNLDIMFVDEKKRELIVLMINGFSVKDAKAYIYRDSLALTVIGIALGVVLGAMMGNVTVGALEPTFGSFLKGFNWLAAAVGIVGAGAFSVAVLLFALRKIPRFDLTDINRF